MHKKKTKFRKLVYFILRKNCTCKNYVPDFHRGVTLRTYVKHPLPADVGNWQQRQFVCFTILHNNIKATTVTVLEMLTPFSPLATYFNWCTSTSNPYDSLVSCKLSFSLSPSISCCNDSKITKTCFY